MSRQKPKKFNLFIKKYKIKSILITSLVISIIALPIVLLSINWANVSILYATGSSALFPLMKELSNTYQQHRTNTTSIDIAIEATGSGVGLEKILENSTNFGNISFSPTVAIVKEHYEQWQSLNIKTVSWGIDGISLVYYGDFNLDINKNNIDDIYVAFSGLKKISFNQLGANNSSILVPYARTGGANKSGTTEAFIKNSGFNLPNNNELIKALNMIKTGQYGNNIQTTKESQSETWHQMCSNPYLGQIAYLSTGFVLQNYDEILHSGYKIATYQNASLTKTNLQNGNYNWRRILNSLISLKYANETLKTWINWILLENYNQNYVKNAFDKIGIIQFTQAQIDQMKLNNDFWISDIELKNPYIANCNFNYGVRLKN